jgi:hypothetical protein
MRPNSVTPSKVPKLDFNFNSGKQVVTKNQEKKKTKV